MKHIITILLLAATVASGGTFPKMEDIYAGAAFARGRDSTSPDIVLVETYNGRFYYGNSWNESPFMLYSNFHDDDGGKRDEVCADLRASDYYYIGKYMEIARPIITQSCQRTHCDTPWPYGIVTNSGPYIVPNAVLTSHWYNNAPNTWPGTYSTNYVTNINANVEAP